jgi:hypothetical protein
MFKTTKPVKKHKQKHSPSCAHERTHPHSHTHLSWHKMALTRVSQLKIKVQIQETRMTQHAEINIVVLVRVCPLMQYDSFNPLNAELNPMCHLLALLGVHHFLHVSRIKVKSLTLRLLMSYIYIYIYIYIYGAPILYVSRSHTTQHSR